MGRNERRFYSSPERSLYLSPGRRPEKTENGKIRSSPERSKYISPGCKAWEKKEELEVGKEKRNSLRSPERALYLNPGNTTDILIQFLNLTRFRPDILNNPGKSNH